MTVRLVYPAAVAASGRCFAAVPASRGGQERRPRRRPEGGAWVEVIVAPNAARDAEGALTAGEPETATDAAALSEWLLRQPFLTGQEDRQPVSQDRGPALLDGNAARSRR